MKIYQPLIITTLITLALHVAAKFGLNLSAIAFQKGLILLGCLSAASFGIIYYLSQINVSDRKSITYFTAGSTGVTILFLILFVVLFGKEFKQFNFGYVALLLFTFLIIKGGFVQCVTRLRS